MGKFFALGLLGFPLSHSLSPRMHQAALDHLGLEGKYVLYPFPPGPGSRANIARLLEQVRAGRIRGLNVTVPYKQLVLPFLDILTPAARAIGAVNTIFLEEGQLYGDNTDASGFCRDLMSMLGKQVVEGGEALVLGAGGSARAVAFSLLENGWAIELSARRAGQAEEMIDNLACHGQIPDIRASVSPFPIQKSGSWDLIVNTTPVGMRPNENASPWPDEIPFPTGAAVYDLVYNPPETRLLRSARAAGLRTAAGLGMLVEQGALAFASWTGLPAPRDIMRAAISQD